MLNPNVRTVLAAAATVISVFGLVASLQENWHFATLLWTLAFLCKSAQCWLLEKWLVAVGSVGGYPNQEGDRG